MELSRRAVHLGRRFAVGLRGQPAARDAGGRRFGDAQQRPGGLRGIATDEGLANRRLVGDLVEIRFYDTVFTSAQASNVIAELREAHIMRTSRASTRWRQPEPDLSRPDRNAVVDVSNATSVVIDNGVGPVALVGSAPVGPVVTTTYTLTATNTNAVRTAQLTLTVDPGVPIARNLTTNTLPNTPRALTLTGSDPQGSNLTFAIVMPPAHGGLSGTPPNVTYTPASTSAATTPSRSRSTTACSIPPGDREHPRHPARDGAFGHRIEPDHCPVERCARLVHTRPFGPSTSPAGGRHAHVRARAGIPGQREVRRHRRRSRRRPGVYRRAGAAFSLRLRATDSTSLSVEQTFA